MSSREWILGRVRGSAIEPRPLPALPEFAPTRSGPPSAALAMFGAALARMGGTLAEVPDGVPLAHFIRGLHPEAEVICSATREVEGTRDIAGVHSGAELEDVDVGVVRAAYGVVETGSVWLSEREFGVDALGFLPQHLVVLLDPCTLVADLHQAYRHAGFFAARYAVLVTGPSATADIEGVLIRGAQGVRSLTVVPWAR